MGLDLPKYEFREDDTFGQAKAELGWGDEDLEVHLPPVKGYLPLYLSIESGGDPWPETGTTFTGYAEHWQCRLCGQHEIIQIPQ